MLTTAYYFLQVIICSGLMAGYYWLVLRNKRFHQYNRFYLLVATLLAWIVPLIKIQVNKAPVEEAQVMQFLYVVADNNTQIDQNLSKGGFEWGTFLAVVYIAVSALLLFFMVRAFVRLYRLLKTHSCKNVGDVFLVLTKANGTPFSFFRYIFWNEEIDIRTETGKQILQHELTHVQQKHSVDKVFMQVVLITGWFNPFFWLIKKELEMIHEFIADKKAVNNGDTASLAQMLLMAAYPQQQFSMVNPFFFSPIKRRLQMLTNNSNPRFTYLRRLVILPLLAFVTVLFAFRSKNADQTLSVASVMENVINTVKDGFEEIHPAETEPHDLTLTLIDATPGSSPDTIQYTHEMDIPLNGKSVADAIKITNPALLDYSIVIDGEKKEPSYLETISPDEIETVSVMKAKSVQPGSKQPTGIITITTKPKLRLVPASNTVGGGLTEVVVTGYSSKSLDSMYRISGRLVNDQPVVYIDGERKEWGSVKPSEIAFVRILKNAEAINKYGDEGRHGAIEVTSIKKFAQMPASVTTGTLTNITQLGTLQNLTVSGYITGGTFSGTMSNRPGGQVVAGTLVATNVPRSTVGVLSPGIIIPSFPGGASEWAKYLDENLDRNVVHRNGAPAGKYVVTVYFMVDPEGKISNLRAENDPGYGTVNAALRVIQKGPKWKPAEVNGKPVHMGFRTTISFAVEPENAGTANGEQVISVVGYAKPKN